MTRLELSARAHDCNLPYTLFRQAVSSPREDRAFESWPPFAGLKCRFPWPFFLWVLITV